jgi:tape measure domain-containing protein
MPEIATLSAKVEINDKPFSDGMKRAEKSLEKFAVEVQAKLNGVVKDWSSFNKRLHDNAEKNLQATLNRQKAAISGFANQVRPLMQAAGLAVAGGIGYSIKKAVDFDSLKRGLTAVAGSAQEAEKQLSRLKELAKLPGLGFEEAVQGSLRLQSAGLSAQMAEKAIKEFGNALALEGKGKAELEGVITALSQIQSKGKVSAEEINQIAERWGGVRKAMKAAFGTADTEAIQKMGITSEQFITKLTAAMEQNERVTAGARASLDNMMDSVNQAAASLGTIFLPTVEAVAAAVGVMAEGFASLPSPVQAAIGWIGAATLGFGLLAAAVAKVVSMVTALKAVIASGVFTKIGAGLAAWGVTLSAIVPAVAAAAVGWTLMATAAVKAFGMAEDARAHSERVSAHYKNEFTKGLDAASGSIEKLRKEWAFTIAGFEKGKVPTFIVEAFTKEVEKLGYTLTDTGIVATQVFAKMAESAKSAMASFREATLAISWRAQSGATDRLGALREQLAATNAAINKITNDIRLPAGEGVTADMFLKAAAEKKLAQGELNRLVGIQKTIEAEILNIEQAEENSKKRTAEWERTQNELAEARLRIQQQFNSILSSDSDTRAFATFGLDAGLLKPLDAARMKLQSIDTAIQALFQQGLEVGIEQMAKNMEVINKLLVDREHALIGVAAAERKLAEAAKLREDVTKGAAVLALATGWMVTFGGSVKETRIEVGKLRDFLQQTVPVLSDTANTEVLGALADISEKMKELRHQAEDWAWAFSDAFIDGLRRVREEGFSGLLRAFEEMLLDMALVFIRSQLVSLMTNLFTNLIGGLGGGIGGGGLGNGSSGGLGQTMTGIGGLQYAGAGGVNITMNIMTPDANSFRNSQDQLVSDAYSAGLSAKWRNG